MKNGAVKRYGEDKWVHITCALFCDYAEIADFASMRIKLHEKTFTEVNNKGNCTFC